jgi:hypothetical protein
MIFVDSAESWIQFGQIVIGEIEEIPDAYGTLWKANRYFDNRLRSVVWKESLEEDKVAALREATRLIDRLNFKGMKTTSEQFKQFPRSGDLSVPVDIEVACYEIAIMLLDELDPEEERKNLTAIDRQYSTVRTTYDRKVVPDYQSAGIPSFIAWTYLLPYLIIPGVTLCRV